MKKTSSIWKFLFSMVLIFLMSNTAFSQKVRIKSIADAKLAFVITIAEDVAAETPERVVGPSFVHLLDGKFDVNNLIMYPQWSFNTKTVSGDGDKPGSIITKQFYAIYNADSHKYLRWSEKDKMLKLVDRKDFNEIWKKKQGTNEYVQPDNVRMSFYFDFKVNGDYVNIYRYKNLKVSSKIPRFSNKNIKLILVER